tara:strand:+ start:2044 stop:4824 length:2781 start_codon:yes stop_codon:yes gene_type:complete
MSFCLKILFLFVFLQSIGFGAPKSVKGEIDLGQWDIEKNKKIDLSGQWHFFWNQIIDLEKIMKEGIPKKGHYINVPGLWSSLNDPYKKGKKLTLGHGTYILKVKGLKSKGKVGFVLPYFATAFKSYIIQGNKIYNLLSSGQVGKTKETSIPTASERTNDLSLTSEDFYIVFHGSNFHYRSGGFFYPLKMGDADIIKKEVTQNNFISFFVLGITFIISVYHFGLFTLRRKDLGSLWFGIFCLTFFLRELSTETHLMNFIDKSLFIFTLNSKLEYLTLFLLPPIQLMFMKSILKDCLHKRIINMFWAISISYSIFTLLTPSVVFTNKLNTLSFQLLVAFSNILYVLYVLIKASLNKVQYGKLLLMAITFLFFGAIYDILVNNDIIISPFISPYTFILFIFIQSYILATKFSIAFKTAENLSVNLEKEVMIRTKEAFDARNEAIKSEENTSNLLNNMRQSVFSVDMVGTIIPPVSEYSQELFGTDIKGKTVFDTLLKEFDKKSEIISQVKFVLSVSIGAELFQYKIISENLPTKVTFPFDNEKEKTLKVNTSPILNKDQKIEKIMFVVEDITELKKLEREAKENEEASAIKIQRLQEVVSNDKKDFRVFTRDVNLNLDLADESIKNLNIDGFFRAAHTIKGTSRIYNLTGLSSEVHLIETKIMELKKVKYKEDVLEEKILNTNKELKIIVEDYLKLGREIFGSDVDETFSVLNMESIELSKTTFFNGLEKLKEIGNERNDQRILDIVKMLELEELREALSSLKKVVSKISTSLNKKIHLEVLGDYVYLDVKMTSMLKDSIMHIVQNSCDHGIDKEGLIKINLSEMEEDFIITILDNGRGIDPAKIKQRALDKRIVEQVELENFTDKEILSLIMRPGFSTKQVATEYSGRGVGLDVVQTNIQKLGGSISINSIVGRETKFEIKIPKSKAL